jgi:hypothetical protein
MLARDWRAGELRVLAAALVVAVASITSVAFFADRVGAALVRDAHQLLGADLVLVSDHPWQSGIGEEIARRGLERAESTTFISMAMAGEQSQLTGVKAGLGQLPLARPPSASRRPPNAEDAPGADWACARHGLDRGAAGKRARRAGWQRKSSSARPRWEVAAVLTLEPERGRTSSTSRRAWYHEPRRRAGHRSGADRQPRVLLPVCGRAAAGCPDAGKPGRIGSSRRGQRCGTTWKAAGPKCGVH